LCLVLSCCFVSVCFGLCRCLVTSLGYPWRVVSREIRVLFRLDKVTACSLRDRFVSSGLGQAVEN
jgi:hypothetical protein